MFQAYLRLFSRFLDEAWHQLNEEYLGGGLNPPVFEIMKDSGLLGSWQRETRTIAISARILLEHSRQEILEVLKHEMAHQYADEVLGADGAGAGETPHGSAFRHACKLLDIHHNATYAPSSEPPPILQKIRKLLALAESGNEHEAHAAMARARMLMDKYELDLGYEDQEFHYTYLGKPRARRSAPERAIAGILTSFFNVKLIWVPSTLLNQDKTVWLMEVTGSQTNLDIATYVYDYLGREIDWLWIGHRAKNPYLKGRTAKRDYQLGVLRGLRQKLAEDQAAVEKEPSKGRQLVVLKQARLHAFFEDRHPHRRAGRGYTYRENQTFLEGMDDGRNLDIHKGIKRGTGTVKRLGSG